MYSVYVSELQPELLAGNIYEQNRANFAKGNMARQTT
jgi:hypothetical protein